MQRPLVGGLGYANDVWSPNILNCTYGFNAYFTAAGLLKKGWITASHCTNEAWSVHSSDSYYQSIENDGPDSYVGYEAFDPSGYCCVFLSPPRHFRYSDAAIIDLPLDPDWDFGQIARTEYGENTPNTKGSLNFHRTDPRFNIADTPESYFEGMPLSKMGMATGWTIGEITDTCVFIYTTTSSGPSVYFCQMLGDYYSEPGDSGAPVFTIHQYPETDVTLNGIHMGRTVNEPIYRVFSPISGVFQDFSTKDLIVIKGNEPGPPPPPPMFIDLNGPDFIQIGGPPGMFGVDVYNEIPPVEYLWYKEAYMFGQPTGQVDTLSHWTGDLGYYQGQQQETFRLHVEVTDSLDRTDSRNMMVDVDYYQQ
ncbi:MAG: hypothetical protein WDZ29_08105 [Balneolaceae bacterium]